MKKLILMAILLLFMGAAVAQTNAPFHNVQIVDESGVKVTTISSVEIYAPDTTTNAVIYADRALQNVITIPMTTTSDNTTLVDGQISWYGPSGYDFSITDGTNIRTNANHRTRTASEGRIHFPSYLNNLSTSVYLDADSITFGTSGDWVANGGNVANTMQWTPVADDSTFNIGTSGASFNSNFNVFTGTALGFKLSSAGATHSLTYDGGIVNLNVTSNFATNICTGTSTGATTIGNSAGGAVAVDTDAGITVNADDSYALTVSAGTIGIAATGGDITVDATDKSLILRGTEEASDAVVIHADGTAGGIDMDSGTGDITATSTDDVVVLAADNITLDTTDGSMTFTAAGAANGDVTFTVADKFSVTSTDTAAAGATIIVNGGASETIHLNSLQGTSAAAINLDADVGGITLLADGAAAGDITIDAEDDIIMTTTGKLTITNTEAVTISGALTVSGATTFSGGQTRTMIPEVVLDGTVPPSQTAVGTSGQSQIPVYSFDANPNATGDDYVFILWRVPVGYVVDSADLFFTFSYSTAETDGDDVVFDITVLALTPGSGAAGGTAFDAAGSAVAALDVDLVNGDGDEGKIMEGTFDIEVTAIAAGDEVLIAFWVDEDQCDLNASGTVDIHKWTITYESTE